MTTLWIAFWGVVALICLIIGGFFLGWAYIEWTNGYIVYLNDQGRRRDAATIYKGR